MWNRVPGMISDKVFAILCKREKGENHAKKSIIGLDNRAND